MCVTGQLSLEAFGPLEECCIRTYLGQLEDKDNEAES